MKDYNVKNTFAGTKTEEGWSNTAIWERPLTEEEKFELMNSGYNMIYYFNDLGDLINYGVDNYLIEYIKSNLSYQLRRRRIVKIKSII